MTVENQNIHTETKALVGHEPQHPAQEAAEGGLLTINGTIVVIIVSFVLFTILMQKIFYAPVTGIRNKRDNHIKNLKDEAEGAAQEAEKLDKEYKESLGVARKKVFDKTSEIISQANHEKTNILEEKKQKVNVFLDEQKQILKSNESQAVDSLKHQVLDYAYRISVKILGEDTSIEGKNYDDIINRINS